MVPCASPGDCGAGERCHEGFCLQSTDPRCGDGRVREELQPGEAGYEACDDGNDSDLDACTTLCQLAVCGDGFARIDLPEGQPGAEECDDGNQANTDDCNNACRRSRCGDGIVRSDLDSSHSDYEECDDDNSIATDGCTNQCEVAHCGDGIVRTDRGPEDSGYEVCDDGNDEDRDACTNGCQIAFCGDGIARIDLPEGSEGSEACDDGNQEDLDDCNNNCVGTYCGDGVVQLGEACDDGNRIDDYECSVACGVGPIQLVATKSLYYENYCVRTEDGRFIGCKTVRGCYRVTNSCRPRSRDHDSRPVDQRRWPLLRDSRRGWFRGCGSMAITENKGERGSTQRSRPHPPRAQSRPAGSLRQRITDEGEAQTMATTSIPTPVQTNANSTAVATDGSAPARPVTMAMMMNKMPVEVVCFPRAGMGSFRKARPVMMATTTPIGADVPPDARSPFAGMDTASRGTKTAVQPTRTATTATMSIPTLA